MGIILLISLQTLALADEGSGSFHGSVSVSFPAESTFDARGLALYVNHTDVVTAFSLQASTVHVERYSKSMLSAQSGLVNGVLSTSSSSYDISNVSITLEGSRQGWFGAYLAPETLVRGTGEFEVSAAGPGRVGNDPAHAEETPDAASPTYEQALPSAHLGLVGAKTIGLDGRIVLKFNGPTLVVRAAENTTTIETGRRDASDMAVRQTNETWVTFELDRASLRFETPSSPDLAIESLDAASRGRIDLHEAQGSFGAGAKTYSATIGGSAWLMGTFTSVLTVEAGLPTTVAATIAGDLRSTDMREATARVAAPQSYSWIPVTGIVLLIAAVGVVAARQWMLRRRDAPTLEECIDLSHVAASEGRYHDALHWTRKAIAHAPSNARLRMDEAFFLAETGDYEGALTTYGAASRASQDGEPDFLAASLILSMQGDPEDAAERLLRALDRTPTLVFEVESDERFARLRRRADVHEALQRAETRI